MKKCWSIVEQLYRLNKRGSSISHVEQGDKLPPLWGRPWRCRCPQEEVSEQQVGLEGWWVVAHRSSQLPCVCSKLICAGSGHRRQVPEPPALPLASPEVRSSGNMDLWEAGGGTVPPCGWRMKLNVKQEGTKSWIVSLGAGGRNSPQIETLRKGRGRENSN